MDELTAADLDLLDNIAELGMRIDLHLTLVKNHIATQYAAERSVDTVTDALRALDAAEPNRWLALAKTDFQTALMKLTRAVVQPTTL